MMKQVIGMQDGRLKVMLHYSLIKMTARKSMTHLREEEDDVTEAEFTF